MNTRLTTEVMLERHCPALTRLGLGQGDFVDLSGQGFLSRERMRGQLRFKLRFRRGGRQVVRYVRPGDVETVRAELSELQAARQLTKELNEATRLAREALRNTKIQLEPLVNELGFRFHGRAIRRPRKQKTSMDAQP